MLRSLFEGDETPIYVLVYHRVMNQAKWLADFKYDVEATPLLWSFDEPEQESLGSNSPLRCRSLSSPILTQWMDLDTTVGETSCSKSLPTKKSRYTTSCQGIKRQRPRTAHRRTRKHELNLVKKSQAGVERHNSAVKPRKESFEEIAIGKFGHTIEAPTYLELQQRENERRRLLSVVKPFPSYLAIVSPEKDDFDIITVEEIQNPPESSEWCMDISRESPEGGSNYENDNLGEGCDQYSAMAGLDNIEYLAGGVGCIDKPMFFLRIVSPCK